MIFIVAALLFYQSHPEGFLNYPIAGRPYNPMAHDTYPVPADLSKAPVSQPQGIIPVSQQRPNMTPGPGTTTAPREAMAQLKDLHELDNKIMLWLDAASQKEREQPGSLTPTQLQRRVILQGRLRDVRDQLGTGMITDTWKQVADELRGLRKENSGWQERSPSLEQVYEFGQGANPNGFLTHEEYVRFYGLFNAAVLELQGLAQPDPLQRVRIQQLQVMRQDLMDVSKRMRTPPIKMAAAQLYLRQMLKVDQPLPMLYSMEPPPQERSLEDNPFDVIADLRDIQWKLSVSYDPAGQELKRAIATMLTGLKEGYVSPQEARQKVSEMRSTPLPFGSPASAYDPNDLMTRASVLCRQVREAFPDDAEALGCQKTVADRFEAETVINTVCDRIRGSVPTVTPEQFGCPTRTV